MAAHVNSGLTKGQLPHSDGQATESPVCRRTQQRWGLQWATYPEG